MQMQAAAETEQAPEQLWQIVAQCDTYLPSVMGSSLM